MPRKNSEISRRNFLKGSGALGAGVIIAPYLFRNAFAASRDRITIYQNTVADSINPYNQSSGSIYGNWQHVIEPLVELDYTKKAWVGVLAESWDFKEKQWTFKLKKAIKFHNGAPLTSQDVVFSVERMRDQKGGSLQASNFNDVTEIQTPDDQTVVFVTKQPLAVFLDRLRNRFIVSKVAGAKYGDQLYQNLVGTGPYKFVSFQRGGNLVFTRNDDYWGGKAAIKEVVFRKVTEDAARLAALESGQADFINAIPVHEVGRLQRHPRIRVDKIEGLEMYFLMMNVSYKPFDNKLVRQAVNHCVDASARRHRLSRRWSPSDRTSSALIRNSNAIPMTPIRLRHYWRKPDTPMVVTCSSIIRPAAIRKTEKCARQWRRRWLRAVSEWSSSLKNGLCFGDRKESTAANSPSIITIADL